MSLISSGRFEKSYEKTVKSKLHDYMGLVFEKMCKEYLLNYADDLPFELSDIGQWWGTDAKTKKEVQIDIVAVPIQEPNKRITDYIIGSCKFKNEKIGINELKLMKEYAEVFGKGRKYYYMIFSLGGFTDELINASNNNEVKLISLSDMYK